MRLLLATRNPGKKREYAQLLEGLDLELVTLDELGIQMEVEETGATFEENALQKARAYAAASGLPTLADDSGLEVDALGGAPGVRSARYAGEGATDAERCETILRELEGVPEEHRSARFRCVIAVVWPDGEVDMAEGTCEGCIALEPRGQHGFGYDPIFYLPALGQTMAQIPPEAKNQISHRAVAARGIRSALIRRLACPK